MDKNEPEWKLSASMNKATSIWTRASYDATKKKIERIMTEGTDG